MQNSKLYEVALGLVPGVGSTNLRLLISYCGSAEAVFRVPRGKLEKIPGVGKTLAKTLADSRAVLFEAEEELKRADKMGCKISFYLDRDFPTRLKQLPDAPCLLYYMGNANLNAPRSISIVGTRHATGYGREITEQIVSDLKPFQPLIVSGLAYGIDIASHRAALQQGLCTVGVMASGIDIVYPAVHKKTADQMLGQGGLLTEYPLGTKPEAYNFPARNRIIAGLADCTIVVEANAKGGALITADIAHSYNRDVMAVPGPINAIASAGCNNLIKQNKAALYSSLADLVEVLNWDLENHTHRKQEPPIDLAALEPEERKLVELLQGLDSELIDTLSWKAQLPISRTASVLLQLEFKGLVKSLPGKKFSLAATR